MNRLLISGGCGYIGSHTAMLAARSGYKVTVIDNLSRGHREFCRWGSLIEVDLRNAGDLKEAIPAGQFDAMIHFGALAYVGESVGEPMLYWQNNVGGTANLVSAIQSAGIPHLVFSSTCAVYGDHVLPPLHEGMDPLPVNPYGRTKLACEQLISDACASGPLRAVNLRYFNASGAETGEGLYEWHEPETHLIPLTIRAAFDPTFTLQIFGTDFATPDHTAVRDYIHVLDLADAHLKALDYLRQGGPSDTFNLGTGVGHSVLEVIEMVEKITRRQVKRTIAARRPGDPPALVADASKARSALNWAPTRNLETSVRDAVNGFVIQNPSYKNAYSS
jgi:UDP-arabinose 4-epimerase